MTINDAVTELESKSHPVSKLLHTSHSVKILVIAFKNTMILKEHKTTIYAKLIVLKGKINYCANAIKKIMGEFDEHEIPINETHSVEALEDSICLLIQG
jgi:quercetin dioxygenase-like cupin family protein